MTPLNDYDQESVPTFLTPPPASTPTGTPQKRQETPPSLTPNEQELWDLMAKERGEDWVRENWERIKAQAQEIGEL